MNKNDKSFICGFAVGVAFIARAHDMPTVAMDVLKSNDITLNDCILAGVGEYDLRVIRKMFKTEW
jgi:hypothetical protein